MLTKRKILKALKAVKDPTVYRSIVELDMVRHVGIKRKMVHLQITLDTERETVKEKVEQQIKDTLYEIGAGQVDLHLTSISDKERTSLSKKLSGHHIVSNGGPRPNLRNIRLEKVEDRGWHVFCTLIC